MTDTKRKVGRPRKVDSRATSVSGRPSRRGPVGGYRDKLTVRGADPDYHYRWVLSEAENSGRIIDLMDQGYAFASSEEHEFGDLHVYKSKDGGSLIRVPANKEGEYLFLMRIRKEWYEEDQREKQKRVLNTEYDTVRQYSENENAEERGVYGKFEIN